jgi:hypothetical protein
MRLDGIDPIEARNEKRGKAAKSAMTFKECAEAYIAAHEKSWKNAKHAAQWPSTMRHYVYPAFAALPVGKVDTDLVIRVVEPIWHSKTETANRVRGRIEKILAWATVNKLRSGDNPARWKDHLDKLLPAPGKVRKVRHLAALPYADLPAFMASLRAEKSLGPRVIEFAIE